MKANFSFLIVCLFVIYAIIGCQKKNEEGFEKLSSNKTGIYFSNTITESDSINMLNYYYCYNGGGVGIADFNNDSLPDVFFTGNMVSSKLYLNKGGMEFEDITAMAGLSTKDWIMGVSVVDINSDGFTDIYLNVAGPPFGQKHHNLLYINNRNLTFTESASKYGLADSSFSVQSAFFDYDRDGDLDMYLLNNDVDQVPKSAVVPIKFSQTGGKTVDKLFENVGDSLGHPYFIDVSKQAGITHEGYGLGLAIADFNVDGWPDIYTSNDFMPNDQLLINQKNKGFTDKAFKSMRHQTYNGMGVDVADINNDGLPDLIEMDMLPENNERRKTMIAKADYENFYGRQRAGYIDQYMRNTLQLNRGVNPEGELQFSEIAQYSGLNATDWSWGVLLADYDNDGYNDAYVTNGFVKDITDLDFIMYSTESNTFGTDAIKTNRTKDMLSKLKGVKISNYAFKNKGDLTFENSTENWGLSFDSYSNGAAYADLDNDGDLDLVTNNINEEAFVFENKISRVEKINNYIQLDLQGPPNNLAGIGTAIKVYCEGEVFTSYFSPVKGYLSSMLGPLHFGLAKYTLIDSVKVTWPNGKIQLIKNLSVNKRVSINFSKADSTELIRKPTESIFIKANNKYNIFWKHSENAYNDFVKEPLLTHLLSQKGPGLAVGDVDGNTTTDFYIGGAAGFPGTLFFQQLNGTFISKPINIADEAFEDTGSLLFDADLDGDLDLYVVSGGGTETKDHNDRLYLNNGKGAFSISTARLPNTQSSGSCVIATDFDHDGDLDIFRAGQYSPKGYPNNAKSYFFRNDKGYFTDISNQVAEGLDSLGMISSAIFTDFDLDGWMDLIVVGEWMTPTFLKNEHGKFKDVTQQTGLNKLNGWWSSIASMDLDNDGDMDYVLGNMGNNIDYHPSDKYPLEMYYGEFGRRDILKPIITQFLKNNDGDLKRFPLTYRDDLFQSIPLMKKTFNSYEAYSKATFDDLFDDVTIKKTKKFEANTFLSGILINKGKGKFSFSPLPSLAQLSCIYGIVTDDVNEDGNLDLIISGNSHSNEVVFGFMDASLGLLLLGDGKGSFQPASPTKSGLFLSGNKRGMGTIFNRSGKALILALSNSDSLTVLEKRINTIRKPLFPKADDHYALIRLKNGKVRRQEFQKGDSYLVQQENAILLNDIIEEISFYNYKNQGRVIYKLK